jgi:hypothetical protein
MDALPRLLAAVTPAEFPSVQRMLAGLANAIPALSMYAALHPLGGDIRLVLCSLHFDDSQMFYLLGELRTAALGIPVLCCRLSDTHLAAHTLEGLTDAVKQLGAVGFVDLRELVRAYGEEEAEKRFAQLVLQQLR